MVWFLSALDTKKDGWRFDAVSLLAVIGESIIERQKHFITASTLSGLPRLLPAPQAIVTSNQLTKLPAFDNVSVVGVYSGTRLYELNYFAGILHDIDQSLPYEVYVCHVGRATNKSAHVPETVSEKGKVRLKPFCAINILTVSSCLVSIGLGVAAILIGDGTALVSIITMSFSSSLACLSQRSYPEIFRMPINHGRQPPGDLVIRTKNGAYIVVHCTEDIFRELYQKRETYSYVFERYQGLTRMLLGSSTVLLMASVLLFSNCGWIMQTAIAATYIILNLAYWATSVLIDGRRFWDLGSLYAVSDKRLRRGHDHISALWAAI